MLFFPPTTAKVKRAWHFQSWELSSSLSAFRLIFIFIFLSLWEKRLILVLLRTLPIIVNLRIKVRRQQIREKYGFLLLDCHLICSRVGDEEASESYYRDAVSLNNHLFHSESRVRDIVVLFPVSRIQQYTSNSCHLSSGIKYSWSIKVCTLSRVHLSQVLLILWISTTVDLFCYFFASKLILDSSERRKFLSQLRNNHQDNHSIATPRRKRLCKDTLKLFRDCSKDLLKNAIGRRLISLK